MMTIDIAALQALPEETTGSNPLGLIAAEGCCSFTCGSKSCGATCKAS